MLILTLTFPVVPKMDPKLNLYINLLPTFPFLTCYIIILFLWAEIFHSTAEEPADLRSVFAAVSGVMYAAVISASFFLRSTIIGLFFWLISL